MQTVAKSNLVLTEFSSFKWLAELQKQISHAGFYQQFTSRLFKGGYNRQIYRKVAEELADLAHNTYNLRQFDTVQQASHLLMALPLSHEWKQVGKYYQAKCLKHQGKINEACTLLEEVAEEAPLRYRARAVQFLGMIYHANGSFDLASSLYFEACRIAASNNWCDPYTTITAQQNMAVLKSMDGDHPGALDTLEKLFPLVRAIGKIEPYKHYHFLNSFAVELAELGHLKEAQNVCKIVLASPLANAYPEWRETGNDIALRSYRKPQSFLSLTQRTVKLNNVLPLPAQQTQQVTGSEEYARNPFQPQASVTVLKEWREEKEEKMVKKPNDKDVSKNETEKDLLFELMELVAKQDFTTDELHKLIKSAKGIVSERKPESDTD